ncbi:transposase [Streptomyces flaveolus]|uniref:transposase n=1 Tax=Streptomyces flaveolus TaxID=67297 RepID=UPI0036ADEDA6
MLGLLSGVERKNCWRFAEQTGHARPGPMQRLLRTARWDADALRDDVRAYVHEHLGADNGVLIVDETDFLKKDTASAGVQRQSGHRGGLCLNNCQVDLCRCCRVLVGGLCVSSRLVGGLRGDRPLEKGLQYNRCLGPADSVDGVDPAQHVL